MIVVVTPNPAVDLTWKVSMLTPGESHRAPEAASRAGGKGINVARVAHSQGADVRVITTAGGATGEELRADLQHSGMPVTIVPVAAATRRTVVIADDADATVINEFGIAPTADEWEQVHEAVQVALEGASVLVISGSVPPGTPLDVLDAWIAAAKERGIAVIVDSSGDALLRAVDAGVTLVKPNKEELLAVTSTQVSFCAARELIARGARNVLVSMGAEGMILVTPSEAHAAKLASPLTGNPTGAGDAGVAACAVHLAMGHRDATEMLRRAVAWSAAAVVMPLAGDISPEWKDLEQKVTVAPLTYRKDRS